MLHADVINFFVENVRKRNKNEKCSIASKHLEELQ